MTAPARKPRPTPIERRVAISRKGGRAEGVTVAVIRQRAYRMLDRLEMPDAELSVLLTNDTTIHELNAQYRGKDRPTDVLAFAMSEGEGVNVPGLLGDVVISLDTATRQALSRRRPVLDEVTMLLAHGLLHLLGYDHAEPEEAREMRNATRVLVRAANAG